MPNPRTTQDGGSPRFEDDEWNDETLDERFSTGGDADDVRSEQAEFGFADSELWTLDRLAPSLVDPIRKTCFWTAIVLPFGYLPLLLAGLTTPARTGAFVMLLCLNLFTLYVGHAHCRED